MNEENRNKILTNISGLMQHTEYNRLMEHCLKIKLLFIEMQEQIELQPTEQLRHRRLLEKITHRGPAAYQKFIQILSLAFPEALAIIQGN